MAYVLMQFFRESRRTKRTQRLSSGSAFGGTQPGRVGRIGSRRTGSQQNPEKSGSHGTIPFRGKARIGALVAMTIASCSAAFGQTRTLPEEAAASPEVLQKQSSEWHSFALAALSSSGMVPPDHQEQIASDQATAQPLDRQWFYGGFIDAAYLLDFNHPTNQLFRSRGTAYKVDEPILNMTAANLRKTASESSRWGMEFTLQGGQDSRIFGFSATAPNLAGSERLRHLGPTDVSYLAPLGKGLTVQAGIFSSLIGYDSLYAKDNFNYTRPWGADFTPYLMMGVNATYPFTQKLTGTVFVVNGYWHLADANNVPSSGGQLAYKLTGHTTLKETVLFGPHQSDTGFEFWRFLWDSIVEWKTDRITIPFEYHLGTEKIATPGNPRALWMSAQLPVHWVFSKNWSATVRPEVYWDRDARLTGFRQTVKANTTTLEYRIPYHDIGAIVRLEHRIDDSRGSGGGFFHGAEVTSGVVGLTPTQNLLILGVIVTFDSHPQP